MMIKRHVNVDAERLYVIVPSEVWMMLFSLERATSRDYVKSESLQAGKIDYFAGFSFINYETVPGTQAFNDLGVTKAPVVREGVECICPCWCASGMVFVQRKEIEVSYSKDPSKWDAPQIMLKASFGATRIEPNKVVCLEVAKAA